MTAERTRNDRVRGSSPMERAVFDQLNLGQRDSSIFARFGATGDHPPASVAPTMVSALPTPPRPRPAGLSSRQDSLNS